MSASNGKVDRVHYLGYRKNRADRSFKFRRNDAGQVRCPMCGIGMTKRETNPALPLAEHFECPTSGIIFYGDPGSLHLCMNAETCLNVVPNSIAF